MVAFQLVIGGLLPRAAGAGPALELPRDVFYGYSLDWLSNGSQGSVNNERIRVYSLSCSKCLEELSAVAAGGTAPDRFMLSTFQSRDRAVSVLLIAYGIAEPDPEKRRRALLDSFALFASSPDDYLEDPQSWEDLLKSLWVEDLDAVNPFARAFAQNVLDMQSRLLAMTDKLETPSAYLMSEPMLAPLVQTGSDRAAALAASLALSWSRPPLLSSSDAQKIEERVRFIDPLKSLSLEEWQALRQEMDAGGLYWLWSGTYGETVAEMIADWQAGYLLIGDAKARRKRFTQWLDEAVVKAKRGPRSPMEVFGMADYKTLASPAWGAAKADAMQHLLLLRYWRALVEAKEGQ